MFPTKEQVERIKEKYSVGTIVQLVRMDDPQAPPVGTKGVIQGVDDIGSVLVEWQTGSRLSLIVGEDDFKVLAIDETIISQILAIRDTGETNMFDSNMVQVIAKRENFFELVIFIEENKSEYCDFILNG